MLNKKYILTLIVILSSLQVYSQAKNYETNPDRKRTFNWLFGDSIWLDFKTNPPIVKSGSKISAIESATAYSDTTGKLLFYSDGITVWNGNHKVIKNGTGLNGHSSSSQGSVFVKHPLLDSIVYLFTTDAQGGSNGFQVNTISINSNLDSSFITEKNKILLNQTCESIAVTQHQNNIYTWVTVHSKTGNTFYAYLINENGIVNCPVTSNEGYMYDGNVINCQTTSAFSDDGKYFAINLLYDFKAQLLAFNNLNGTFKLTKQFTSLNVPTGLSFSNDNKYLYIVERGKQINQIKISNWQNNIVKNINNKFLVIDIEKTPYKEIYVNVLDSLYIASIKFPDSIGLSANFNLRNVFLKGKKGKNGLCNSNRSYFYTPSIDFKYHLNCITNIIAFNGLDTFSANTHIWQIGKMNKPLEATYITKNISHTFIDTGSYNVRYIAQNGSRFDTITKTITLYTKINKSFLGKDTTYYTGDLINKTLQVPYGMHCQLWQDSSGLSTYAATKKGIYTCKVTNQAFCEVIDTIEIKECLNLSIPSIYHSNKGDTLFCSHQDADTFIWYKNNVPYKTTHNIGNKTSFIKLTDTGTYRVEATKYGHCNRSSANFNINKLGSNNVSLKDFNIKIFPNPSSGNITIENNSNIIARFNISNIIGEVLYQNSVQEFNNNYDLILKQGIYIITLEINNQTIKHKLIIQ